MNSDTKVSTVMTNEVVASAPEDTISTVISRMTNLSIHELPIVDRKKKLLGYFSFDILARKKHVPLYTKVERLMVAPPKVGEEESVFDAAKVMLETGFRALPVVDGEDVLKGVISETDIVKIVPRLDEVSKERADEIMTPEPEVLNEKDDIEMAVDLMLGLGELSAPLVDEQGRIAGSVLIEDIGKSMWFGRESVNTGDLVGENNKPKIELKSFVSPVAVVKQDELLREVCKKMGKINPYLCIVADDLQKPIGVITQYDVLKRLVRYRSERGVFVDITGLDIRDPFVYSSIVSKLERFVKKVGRYSWITPYTLNLHIQRHDKGGKKRWGLRGKFMTDKGLLYVKSQGWDVLPCVDEITGWLERKIMSLKPERGKISKSRPDLQNLD